MMKAVLLIPALFLLTFRIVSQPGFPEDGIVFNDATVPRIDITIHPDTLAWIYNNVESNIEWCATFIFNNGTITDTVEEVGFRLRGNTSRYSAKKSFKISFNTYQPGRKWHDLKKMNLNGEHNDPTICRSKLSWDLLRSVNVPAPRSNHVRIYINGNYYGLYINVEHINADFVKSRYGNRDGNLYKCLYPADLKFLGTNPDLYKTEYWGRRAYELKTNEELDDYTGLANFIEILNNSGDPEFKCRLYEVFNVYDYLKVMAVDVLIGNWDGYIYNKNNYYLYHNSSSGKFEYIPYDLDNTWGIDWIGRDWGTRDIYDWQQHGEEVRPLYTRIIDNQELKDVFSEHIQFILDHLMDTIDFFSGIDALKLKIEPYVQDDPFYPLDYGYTMTDFHNSFNQGLAGHAAYGLKPYINTRRSNAYSQLQWNPINPVINHISNNQPLPDEHLWVRAYIYSPSPLTSVKLEYTVNNGTPQFVFMFDDGQHFDDEAGDGIYGGLVPNFAMNTVLKYQVSVTDEYGYSSIMPCEPLEVKLLPSNEPKLYINEFMAKNDTVIADEFGEFDDWIEIYNGDVQPVWLGNKYLTDNLNVRDKWQLPDITLLPGEFILIWADGQPEQGVLHAGFRLNKDGEEIGLFDSEITGFYPLDTIVFGEQLPNISFGRETDGGPDWGFLQHPTPGYSNMSSSVSVTAESPFQVFPNPASGKIVHFTRIASVELYNATGQKVLKKDKVQSISLENLHKGLYFLATDSGSFIKLIVQ
jgi:hypothetical protein